LGRRGPGGRGGAVWGVGLGGGRADGGGRWRAGSDANGVRRSVREQRSVPCYSEPWEGMELLEGLGVSVARGIEGRPRSVARAGAWPGSFGTTAASRRVAERSSCVACSSTKQKVTSVAGSTGREGKSAGVQARHSWPGSEQACATLRCSARRSSAGVKEEREDRERRDRVN